MCRARVSFWRSVWPHLINHKDFRLLKALISAAACQTPCSFWDVTLTSCCGITQRILQIPASWGAALFQGCCHFVMLSFRLFRLWHEARCVVALQSSELICDSHTPSVTSWPKMEIPPIIPHVFKVSMKPFLRMSEQSALCGWSDTFYITRFLKSGYQPHKATHIFSFLKAQLGLF